MKIHEEKFLQKLLSSHDLTRSFSTTRDDPKCSLLLDLNKQDKWRGVLVAADVRVSFIQNFPTYKEGEGRVKPLRLGVDPVIILSHQL